MCVINWITSIVIVIVIVIILLSDLSERTYGNVAGRLMHMIDFFVFSC